MRGLRSNVGKKQRPSYNDAKILFERQFILKFLETPIISYRKFEYNENWGKTKLQQQQQQKKTRV